MSKETMEPTAEQVEKLVQQARDLPTTDVCRQAYETQRHGQDTLGGQLLRRMIAEILALRALVHRMRRGE